MAFDWMIKITGKRGWVSIAEAGIIKLNTSFKGRLNQKLFRCVACIEQNCKGQQMHLLAFQHMHLS